MLNSGLYEQIINKAIDIELASTDKLRQTAPIDAAEASKAISILESFGEKASVIGKVTGTEGVNIVMQ